MRPASDRFKAAVTQSHSLAVQVDVLRDNAVIQTLNTVESGTVTLDASANVRGRGELAILDDGTLDLIPTSVDDPLAPYGNEIKVYRGVLYPDGTTELVSLGVFRIDNPRTSEQAGTPTINITGQDRSARIIDARFEAPYEVTAGTNLITAISDLILPVYPDVDIIVAVDTSATTGTVIAEAQSDRWEFAGKLAVGAGARLYFDGDGALVIAPEVTPGPAAIELVEGENGVLVSAASDWRREGARNVIVATGENTGEAAPARGVAEDLDPTSPTYVHGRFGRVVGFYSSPILTTDSMATAAARTILARSTGTTQSVEFGSLVLPHVEPGDIAHIKRSILGIDQAHILETVSLPLSHDGVMTGRTRMVQVTS